MWMHRFRVLTLSAIVILLAGLPGTARATLNIAQSPLFVAVSIDPNVMFLLDDSGSMHWELMPDAMVGGGGTIYFTFPRPAGVYGNASNYDARILAFHDGFLRNVRSRSGQPGNNAVFYNPENTYRPWVNADGTSLPNADPTAALYNPRIPGVGSLNLTAERSFNRWRTAGGTDENNRNYYPITFYVHTGGNLNSFDNYVKYQIRGTTGYRQQLPGTTETTVTSFTWPNGVTRTVLEERQNFANWFTYYRSRILSARAGIGFAFVEQPDLMRVGFGALNKGSTTIDGVATRAIVSGVRPFNPSNKEAFFDDLYDYVLEPANTPLRRALNDAGQYYSRTDARGPWSTTPGATGGSDLACRQSFTILMTDGFWNVDAAGTAAARANNDGTAGPTITGPGGQSYTYAAVSPFKDDHSDTLADVAMYYWKNDLRTDIDNLVPTTDLDPAFWQHMVTFGVGLGVEGSIDPAAAFAAIETGDEITWPNPGTDAGAARLDDLLHAGLNGRGGFFSASDPETFARELSAVLSDIVARTAATTGFSLSSTRLTTDSLIYAGEFSSEDWSGDLIALDADDATPEWVASERIATLITDEGLDARKVFTWTGADGDVFHPGTADVVKERIVAPLGLGAPLDAAAEQTADDIINYVRGDKSNEVSAGGTFRNRGRLIGDIVNSEPVFAGSVNEGWARLPGDQGGGVAGAGSYGEYLTEIKRDPRICAGDPDCDGERYNTVYVGANDGMLHAIDARTGRPLFSYVPAAVHHKLHELTDPDYGHRFFVDGSITVADARIGGSWKSVLLGTLGAGGRGIFALDVTRPQSFDQDNVLWELTSEDDPDIGFTYGKPEITRLEDGTWVAIFGNGYNSATPRAHLFVVRLADGEILHKVPVGPVNNGLSGVAVWVDPESRLFAARVYAGDLRGTMWRFEFTNSVPASHFTNGLFRDPGGRAVTSTPTLAANPAGGVMVYFGTGKLIEPGDRLIISPPAERFWALRDQNVALGNTLDGFGKVELDDFVGVGVPDGTRTAEVMTVGEKGWYVNLRVPDGLAGNTGERVISSPLVFFGRVIFSTFEPSEEPCIAGGFQRLYVLNAVNGGPSLDSGSCPGCAGLLLGAGAPVNPPVAIRPVPPPVGGGGGGNPGDPPPDPEDPDDDTAPGTPPVPTGTGREGWCDNLLVFNALTNQWQVIGTACVGRGVWRQIR